MKEIFSHETLDVSDEIQQECIEVVRWLMADNPTLTHQDATNVYFYNKIAELAIRITKLENIIK